VSYIPLFEVTIEDSAGKTLSADSDTLQYTVTPQLVDNQEVLHETYNLHHELGKLTLALLNTLTLNIVLI
jgi:hypothetical protein